MQEGIDFKSIQWGSCHNYKDLNENFVYYLKTIENYLMVNLFFQFSKPHFRKVFARLNFPMNFELFGKGKDKSRSVCRYAHADSF